MKWRQWCGYRVFSPRRQSHRMMHHHHQQQRTRTNPAHLHSTNTKHWSTTSLTFCAVSLTHHIPLRVVLPSYSVVHLHELRSISKRARTRAGDRCVRASRKTQSHANPSSARSNASGKCLIHAVHYLVHFCSFLWTFALSREQKRILQERESAAPLQSDVWLWPPPSLLSSLLSSGKLTMGLLW